MTRLTSTKNGGSIHNNMQKLSFQVSQIKETRQIEMMLYQSDSKMSAAQDMEWVS